MKIIRPAVMYLLFVSLAVSIASRLPAQENGFVSEVERVESKILGETMNVSIYFPPSYANDDDYRKYPVLYLLHGYGDDHTGWVQFGEVARIADEAIKSGKAAQMLIVMPDAKKTFYMNRSDGTYQYEDYFFQELIPYIEGKYPCRATKEFRAVAGLSMGGFGSFLYALKHPNMFGSSCPLSAAAWFDEDIKAMPYDQFQLRFKEIIGDIEEGEERITDFWKANSFEHLTRRYAEERDRLRAIAGKKEASDSERQAAREKQRAMAMRFYIDCGDDDGLVEGNMKLFQLMREKKIDREFRIRDGGHSWSYWRSALPEVLEFVSAGFHR